MLTIALEVEEGEYEEGATAAEATAKKTQKKKTTRMNSKMKMRFRKLLLFDEFVKMHFFLVFYAIFLLLLLMNMNNVHQHNGFAVK